MIKNLKLINRLMISLVMVLSPVISIALSPQTYATSVYDSVVDKVDTLELHNSSCATPTYDYSDNWIEAFVSSTSSINYQDSTQQALYTDLFENRTHWGISQQVSQQTYGMRKDIIIWWTDSSTPPEISFQMDGSRPIAAVEKTGNGAFAFIGVNLDQNTWCTPRIHMRSYTTGNGFLSIASEPSDLYSWLNSTIKPWRQSAPVTYPSGYAGQLLNKEITGSATCGWGDMEITKISVVNEDLADGNALITDNAYYGKDYVHYLTRPDEDYYLLVFCDGQVAPSALVDNTVSSNLNWACVEVQLTQREEDYLCYAS